MHDGGTPVRRAPDRGKIQQVIAVNAVIADDIMTEALQVSRYRGTHVTAMPRDQDPHRPVIGRRSAARQRISLTSGAGWCGPSRRGHVPGLK
jgi:hypothetical protein